MDGGLDRVDGCFGEAWAGAVPDGSHVNLVFARRGSPTIVLNKATIASDLHGRITWGAAQLGIAAGVMDCVADGVFSDDDAAQLVLLVAVWVDPRAADETAVRAANRAATRRAVEDALSTDRGARIR